MSRQKPGNFVFYGKTEIPSNQAPSQVETPFPLMGAFAPVVQDTNAYTIQEPQGLGALAASLFKRASESRKWSASSTEIHPIKRRGQVHNLGAYQAGFMGRFTRSGRQPKPPCPSP